MSFNDLCHVLKYYPDFKAVKWAIIRGFANGLVRSSQLWRYYVLGSSFDGSTR